MPSGIRGRGNPDYSSTEYAQPWGGIDVSKPSSQIEPSCCVSLNGAIIRGGLTTGPNFITPPVGVSGTTVPPALSVGEVICLISNLQGYTILITNSGVWTDISLTSPKAWSKAYTFPSGYPDTGTHFGSVIIGNDLYFSSSAALGVYQLAIAGSPAVATVTEISAQNGSGPFIGGDFLFTVANRLCLWNIIGGDGNQNVPTPSTSTHYPDRVAWSFPSAYGFFDPNAPITAGGFDQITEARGLGTGAAVFEAVAMLAHNGGFTEMVPNINGGNIEPFTFAPLWSADQGIVCRYGSMAQYGSMCCFLGFDQPYQLSPGGLTPVGNQIASLVQNFSQWNDPTSYDSVYPASGINASIVEIEGEKHYILGFASNITPSTSRDTMFFDCNLTTNSWTTFDIPGFTQTCPVYQSYDTQAMDITGPPFGNIRRDNWLLVAGLVGAFTPQTCTLYQFVIGRQLVDNHTVTPAFTSSLIALFRAETPLINIPQTTRKVMVEYENLPALSATPTVIGIELFGQPLQGGYPNVGQTPVTNTFSVACPYYASGSNVPSRAVLTAFSEPIGTANTTLATSLQLTTAQPIRLIRVAIVAETTQGDQK